MMLHRLRFMRSNLSEFGAAAPIGQSTSWSSSVPAQSRIC